MNTTPVVELDRVSKRYGNQDALVNVSLDLPSGHVFALLGENGAGKTSMIRILLGLTPADQGTARVLGLNSQTHGLQIRQRIGYVSERPTLYEWMTVEEAGWFGAGFYPDGYLERYRELVTGFELRHQAKIKSLSKGMRAKVALALAMAHEPSLLVLDEPTSGLDPLVRRQFLESMVDLTADGRTVLISSHQISEVERVADVVGILHQGRLIVKEPLDQLKATSCEITATLSDPKTPLEVPGAVIHQRRKGRQCHLLMRGEPDINFAAVRSLPLVQSAEIRMPNLEDIFVAYMQTSTSQDRHVLVETEETVG